MSKDSSRGIFSRFLDFFVQLGLGESLLRVGTVTLSVVLLGVVIWLIRSSNTQAAGAGSEANAAVVVPTVAAAGGVGIPQPVVDAFGGVPRLAQERTIIPSRPRQEILKYTVLEGDTIFGISERFGLKPETILWGNYYVLLDNPHSLQPGQELSILPVNGTYHEWNQGEGLNGVAK
ncbi:MAG: LysM peptidoglycan-binding domain-containing protein, partial [Anaerolineales bacterium]|nr:LysM peptidoglycan-binding domain-containing protein [Anaerolineales bacterium]